MSVCMYVCLICMYACMYVCIHVCMYVCMYVCVYVCVYVCMYVLLSIIVINYCHIVFISFSIIPIIFLSYHDKKKLDKQKNDIIAFSFSPMTL